MRGEALPPIAGIDAALSELVLRACAFDRRDRFGDASEMRMALEAVAGSGSHAGDVYSSPRDIPAIPAEPIGQDIDDHTEGLFEAAPIVDRTYGNGSVSDRTEGIFGVAATTDNGYVKNSALETKDSVLANTLMKLCFVYLEKGTTQDDAKAAELLLEVAEQGYVDAQYTMGLLYKNGRGVPRNDTQAERWFKRAAEQGLETAKQEMNRLEANNPKIQNIGHEIKRQGENVILGIYGGKPLKWQVLADESDRVLIISKDCITRMPFNEWVGYKNTTWETCSLRDWLNGSFYNEAFSTAEKSRIQKTHIPNYGSNDTNDRVFLLSSSEVKQYFTDDVARIAEYDNKQAWWWLRSQGNYSNSAAAVRPYGSVYDYGLIVYYRDYAVRPAVYIKLES
jgi:TPR repeat protein